MIAQRSTHDSFSPQEINENIMRSVLNGKYTLKQTIHDSCWKWKTDVLQRRESIRPRAAKTQRPKIRPMNFYFSFWMYMHIQWECSMCIAPILRSLRTAFLPADGTEKSRQALQCCPGWQHPATAHCKGAQPSNRTEAGLREAQLRFICFTDPYLDGKWTFGLTRNV